jgi:hypothetical protein
VADAFSLLFFPAIPILMSSFSIPSSFVMRIVSRTIGIPSDPAYFAYFVVLGTILQMFLLGLAWELLVDKISKLIYRNRVPA